MSDIGDKITIDQAMGVPAVKSAKRLLTELLHHVWEAETGSGAHQTFPSYRLAVHLLEMAEIQMEVCLEELEAELKVRTP